MMVYVVLTLGFFAFQALFPAASDAVLANFLNFKFGLTALPNFTIIGSVIWFLLLVFAVRYFQISTFVERQYIYLHCIEEKINKEFGEELIIRESKAYLDKYPLFSAWMWVLYTIIFPILLFLVSGVKIFKEIGTACTTRFSLSLFLDIIIFVLLAISIVLYLIMLHKKSKK